MNHSAATGSFASSYIAELTLGSWDAYLDLLGAELDHVQYTDGVRANRKQKSPQEENQGTHADASNAASQEDELSDGANKNRSFKIGETWSVMDVGPSMRVLPPGKLLMGAHPLDPDAHANEKPRHEVTIPHAFAVSTTPITFAQWDACVADGGSKYVPTDSTWGRGQRPAINISWFDAEEYIAWLNQKTGLAFRLLTEAEWEYACWGGKPQDTRYPWGDDFGFRQLERHVWFYDNSGLRTQEVEKKPSNAWGLYDMLGQVTEWVQDHYSPSYTSVPIDGAAHLIQSRDASRVMRGGSWMERPRNVRPSAREHMNPAHRSYKSGFRIALTVTLNP